MSMESVTTYEHELPPTQDGKKRVLSYGVLGLPKNSHTPPEQHIIYHHGWPSCRFEALPLAAVALNLNWQILAIDRPGIGKSTYNPSGTFSSWAADVEHLMDAQGIKKAVFMGCSGGGPFALACSRYLPHRTAALVTISSMVATNDPANRHIMQQMHWMDRLQSYMIDSPLTLRGSLLLAWPLLALSYYPARIAAQLPGSIALPLLQLSTAAGWAEPDRQMLLNNPELTWRILPAMLQQSVWQGIAGLQHDIAITSNKWSFELEDIRGAPVVLIVQGEEDINTPKAMAEQLVAKVPDAKPLFYPGESHLSVLVNQAGDILVTLAAALKGK